MSGAAPPSAWAPLGPGSGALPPGGLPPAAGAGPEAISAAWKHVRNVVSADARPSDLYDLLSHSVRETQYSFQPQGVSALGWGCQTLCWQTQGPAAAHHRRSRRRRLLAPCSLRACAWRCMIGQEDWQIAGVSPSNLLPVMRPFP